LRTECERAKIALSSKDEEKIQVANISSYDGKYIDMSESIFRKNFNELIENDINDGISQVRKALEEANVNAKEVDQVLLIGGSSRIPLVRQKLREMFGYRIVEIENANTIIAEGAAIVDTEGLQPILARSLNLELSDKTLYEVFSAGFIADPNVCHKKLNFFCVDNRDGEAKLVLKDLAGRIDATHPLMKKVLSIPVSNSIPERYQHERVTVEFVLDEDMILHVSGKGATQGKGATCEIFDLCFSLRLEGDRDAIRS
jgi:molecular chaperone DnaK (HSP70)